MPQDETHATDDDDDAITRLAFSVYGNLRVYALLLGSGLSRAAGIPTGWEVTLDLTRRVALAQGEADQQDWAAWYKEKFGGEPNYSDLIALLGPSSHERRAILDSYIEPTEEDLAQGRKVPTRAHTAIAELVHTGFIRVIITTNFDRLLENALRAVGTEPTVLDSVDAIRGAEPLVHTKCYLVKLHGDYKDARILNTDAELGEYAPEFATLLDRILDEHGLVVCGWSGEWDEALRGAITRNPSRRYSLFWAARGAIGDTAHRMVTHRNGHVVPIADADDFFCKLRDQVQTLARTHRQNPAHVQLLVSSTKRFAAKPEHRIELHDLVESETRRLLHRLLNSTPQVDRNAQGVKRLVDFQESSAEPLGRMFGVLGRWDDGTEHDTVVNAIIVLWARLQETESSIPALHQYPAVLLLWAYGTGLALAERWRCLHGLLSQPVPSDSEYDHPKRLVYTVSHWFVNGNRNNIWNQLPGLKDHHTPAFDHLLDILNGWRDSFAAVHADFEGVHDVWEILFALTYCEAADGEPTRSGLPFWSPLGRVGWRHRSRERILQRIRNTGLRRELVEAGFADGDDERLTAIVDDYARFLSEMHWR